jgi:hypothetical protein
MVTEQGYKKDRREAPRNVRRDSSLSRVVGTVSHSVSDVLFLFLLPSFFLKGREKVLFAILKVRER